MYVRVCVCVHFPRNKYIREHAQPTYAPNTLPFSPLIPVSSYISSPLQALHANGENEDAGVNGLTGEIARMADTGVWEPYQVKVQTFKTAIESACMLLRIDDIVSGAKAQDGAYGQAQASGQLDQ